MVSMKIILSKNTFKRKIKTPTKYSFIFILVRLVEKKKMQKEKINEKQGENEKWK